jgi:flavodoxin
MKALVTYVSHTGNTEKVARAMGEIIHVEKDIMPVNEVHSVEQYDVIFCGFPVQSHSVPPEAANFIRNLPEGKKVALFATHGSLRGGHLAVTAIEQAVSLTLRAKVLGTFGCRGKVSGKLIDALMEKPEHKAWAIEAQGAHGHPDRADLEDAQEFAKNMMAKASSL